ncbi:hypothetical protein [Christiangramia sp.]|uniref:hypothetical protein n=1 Tax=Christiangramia sp. TaxID=1931228 RepID=UPI002613C1C7|nr:hypothetical protein [Christiangramia sp.]
MKEIKEFKRKKKNDFPPGYGKFPYVVVKIGYARYLQIPIHRTSKEEDFSLKGIFISEEKEPDIKLKKEHDLYALMQVRKQNYQEKNIYLPMCLVEGPEDAVYIDEQGNTSENSSIPKGGVLLTANHDIISMEGPHYYLFNE